MILLLISLVGVSSCQEKNKGIDNLIAIGYQKDDIYLINSDNNSLLLEGVDLIQEDISEYMYIRKNGLYGFINNKGEEIIKPIYEKAFPMNENKALVKLEGKTLIINNLGEVLYTLPVNVTSTSYFSCNRLVLEKNGKFAYLEYIPESNEFILPGEFIYDYALPFSEGFGVVGIETDQTAVEGAPKESDVKYNFLGLDNILLFEDFIYDYAESFTNGLAKVGTFTKDVSVPSSGTGNQVRPPKYYDMMVYSYIYPNGNYLINKTTNEVLTCHYGSIPCDGIIVTAITKYYINNDIEDNLFKYYTFYTTEGAVAYESCFTYTSHENINIFWPTNLVKLGDNHIFAYGKQSVSWNLALAIETELDFKGIQFVIDQNASWISELANEYYVKNSFIENTVKYPYHISDIKRPEFIENPLPLAVVQVSFNDNGKYGILKFNYNEQVIIDNPNNVVNAYSVSYLVPPIYDRIVI